jgi:hypothetical protein
MTMMIIIMTRNTKADIAAEGARKRRLSRGLFEFMNNERYSEDICIIDRFQSFGIGFGDAKDLSTDSIF